MIRIKQFFIFGNELDDVMSCIFYKLEIDN